MGAFIGFFLVVALAVYSGYFFWINTVAASFDAQSKMLTIYLWRGLTFLSPYEDLTVLMRPSELVVVAAAALVLGWLIGWRMGHKGIKERQKVLQQTQSELQQVRQQVTTLQSQLLEAYRQHELRLTDLAEKLLSITRAALPTTELQVESLPLVEAPTLPERRDEPSQPPA